MSKFNAFSKSIFSYLMNSHNFIILLLNNKRQLFILFFTNNSPNIFISDLLILSILYIILISFLIL